MPHYEVPIGKREMTEVEANKIYEFDNVTNDKSARKGLPFTKELGE